MNTLTNPAKVARIGKAIPSPRYPEPQDPPIVTRLDKGAAFMVWAVGPIASVAIVAGIVVLINYIRN